jgi:hypothetical protein
VVLIAEENQRKAVMLNRSYTVTEEFMMKYQQLENLESGWKWKYLVKKHREGELITRHIETSVALEAIDELLKLENEPVKVLAWIDVHMNPALDNRMKQTIRARRKRHFNAEHQHTRKKSIDLEFLVWQRLAALARRRGVTLSETVVQLIEDAERKEKYASQMSSLKQDLKAILGKDEG